MMDSSRFAYFLNAVHYCIWLNDIKFGEFNERIAHYLLDPIPKFLFTKEWRERYYERAANSQKDLRKFFYDKKKGFHIKWANHWFGYLYSGYPGFLSFLMLGLIHNHYGEISFLIKIITIIVPIGICYIPAYKAVFLNDRYLKYFKEFEKEGKEWHRRWARITWVFCIGAVIVSLCGIAVMLEIMIGLKNIDFPFLHR